VAITAASTTALELLDASDRPMPIHSIYASGVNLRCGDHLVYASSRPDGGVAALCMTVNDVELLCGQRSWEWTTNRLVGVNGRAVIGMDEAAATYPTSPPPTPLPSAATPHRLACARARTGRRSWFDTGVGLRMGMPRLRTAIRALVRQQPDAAERLSGIIGLGAGLTPSADDALVGALCVMSANGALSADLREHVMRRLRADGALATTDVSMSYLRLAFDGAFSSPVTRVVGCLAESNSQADLDEAVRVLSEHGAASGMDTAIGIQLACEFLAQSSSSPNSSSDVSQCESVEAITDKGPASVVVGTR
jgi:hypothetical protein